MSDRRVVITGLGVVSALGHSLDAHWASVEACQPGIRPLSCADADQLSFPNGAEL